MAVILGLAVQEDLLSRTSMVCPPSMAMTRLNEVLGADFRIDEDTLSATFRIPDWNQCVAGKWDT